MSLAAPPDAFDAAEALEHARRILAREGIPIELVDRLAVSPRVAGKLLSVSLGMVEKLISSGELPAFQVGRAVRIEVVDLVLFMRRNRKIPRNPGSTSLRARALDLIDGGAA